MSAQALVPTTPSVPVPERQFRYLSWPHVFLLQALGRITAPSPAGWGLVARELERHARLARGIAARSDDLGDPTWQERLAAQAREAEEEYRQASRVILPGEGLVAAQDPVRSLELALATLRDSRMNPLKEIGESQALVPAGPQKGGNFLRQLVRHFEGQEIRAVTYRGQLVMLARDVGRALGYERDGKQFIDAVTGEWAEDINGDAIRMPYTEWSVLLRQDGGGDFPPPRYDHEEVESPSSKRGGHRGEMVFLTRDGLMMACSLSRKPVGKLFRQWAVKEVFAEILETGSYNPPAPAPSPDLAAVHGEMARLRARLDEMQEQLATGTRPVRTPPAQGTLPLLPEASVATPSPLEAFVALWLAKDGGAWASSAELLTLAQEAGLVGPETYPGQRAQLCRLGRILSADPQLAEHQVVHRDTRKVGGRKYAVEGR